MSSAAATIRPMLAVSPGIQSAGTGRALFEAAASYGRAAESGLIVSSNDPRALRLYADSGFALHPTFEAEGVVDRRRLPGHSRLVRDDDGSDLESLAALTRAIRGAPYTAELGFVLGQGGRLLRLGDRGFAVVARARLPMVSYGALCVRGTPGPLVPFLPSSPFA